MGIPLCHPTRIVQGQEEIIGRGETMFMEIVIIGMIMDRMHRMDKMEEIGQPKNKKIKDKVTKINRERKVNQKTKMVHKI